MTHPRLVDGGKAKLMSLAEVQAYTAERIAARAKRQQMEREAREEARKAWRAEQARKQRLRLYASRLLVVALGVGAILFGQAAELAILGFLCGIVLSGWALWLVATEAREPYERFLAYVARLWRAEGK